MNSIWVIVFIVFVVLSAVQKMLESREAARGRKKDGRETREKMHERTRKLLYGSMFEEEEQRGRSTREREEHGRTRIEDVRRASPGHVDHEEDFEEALPLFGPSEQMDKEGPVVWRQAPAQQPSPQRQAQPRRQAPPRRAPVPQAAPRAEAPESPQAPVPPPQRQAPREAAAPPRARPPRPARGARPTRPAQKRPAPVAARARPRRGLLFANIDDVRRGIIMSEVLGPPKGFE